jgi:gluconate 2-dehydrogenase gamma chain
MPAEDRPIKPNTKLIHDTPESPRVTRRTLVRGSGALVMSSVVTGAASGCTNILTGTTQPALPTPVPVAEQYPVPPPPDTPPVPGELQFFSEEQARTLDALVATILPGSSDDPGAREAGVVAYIDNLLASFPDGFAQPIYREGPFAEPYAGDQPPASGTEAEVVWVQRDELPRYGYQSFLTPREIYSLGLEQVALFARSRFGQDMAALNTEQQQEVVRALAAGEIGSSDTGQDEEDVENGFSPPSLQDFFQTVRGHVTEGMFCDPAYGGNRGMVGWKLIGFPGAQRAYTARDMRTPGIALRRAPQTLAELPPFHPGVRLPVPGNENVVLPVSGSDPWSGNTGHDHAEGS